MNTSAWEISARLDEVISQIIALANLLCNARLKYLDESTLPNVDDIFYLLGNEARSALEALYYLAEAEDQETADDA